MKYLSLMLMAWLLIGCATTQPYSYLDGSDKPDQDRMKDEIECQSIAAQAAQGSGGWSTDPAIRSAVFTNVRDQYVQKCLESRGWRWKTRY